MHRTYDDLFSGGIVVIAYVFRESALFVDPVVLPGTTTLVLLISPIIRSGWSAVQAWWDVYMDGSCDTSICSSGFLAPYISIP